MAVLQSDVLVVGGGLAGIVTALECLRGGLRVTLHQRKRLIAAQLGIAPETLSRVLRHLREHGLIAGTGNVLSLPQPRALQMVAGF